MEMCRTYEHFRYLMILEKRLKFSLRNVIESCSSKISAGKPSEIVLGDLVIAQLVLEKLMKVREMLYGVEARKKIEKLLDDVRKKILDLEEAGNWKEINAIYAEVKNFLNKCSSFLKNL